MMDILALTEISEKEDTGFLINVEIAGYDFIQLQKLQKVELQSMLTRL